MADMNPYRYADADPMTHRDPLGLESYSGSAYTPIQTTFSALYPQYSAPITLSAPVYNIVPSTLPGYSPLTIPSTSSLGFSTASSTATVPSWDTFTSALSTATAPLPSLTTSAYAGSTGAYTISPSLPGASLLTIPATNNLSSLGFSTIGGSVVVPSYSTFTSAFSTASVIPSYSTVASSLSTYTPSPATFSSPAPSGGVASADSGVAVPLTLAVPAPSWNTGNVVSYVQANYPRSDWSTGLVDAVHAANQTGASYTAADVQAAQTSLQATKQQLDSWSAAIQNPGPYRPELGWGDTESKVGPGTPGMVRDQVLQGTWRVTLHAGGVDSIGHAFLTYQQLGDDGTPTGILHTAGNYQATYGGWAGQPATVAGAQWDIPADVKRFQEHRDEYVSLSAVVQNPRTLPNLGFSVYGYNTCATYARDAWYRHTGQYFLLITPSPYELSNAIKDFKSPPREYYMQGPIYPTH